MSDAGYTLVETLTALAIVAMAIGGLTAGVQVLTRRQDAVNRIVADTEALRAVHAAVQRGLDGHGPFRAHEPQRFTGGADAFRFDCGEAAPCVVALVDAQTKPAVRIEGEGRSRVLPLRTPGPLNFRYEGALGSSAAWPPEREDRQALRSVSIVREGAAERPALIKARVWAEQPIVCQFDVILQDCR